MTAVPLGGQRPGRVARDDWGHLSKELEKMSSGSMTAQDLENADPSQLGNDPKMEMAWAEKAGRHAEAYFSVLRFMPDKRRIKLTKIDETIYNDFRQRFPKLKIGIIDENFLKSVQQKKKWRLFCMRYENNPDVIDFNMATLMRLNAGRDYTPVNTTIVPRIQFVAIEIARNREGFNSRIGSQTVPTYVPTPDEKKAMEDKAAADDIEKQRQKEEKKAKRMVNVFKMNKKKDQDSSVATVADAASVTKNDKDDHKSNGVTTTSSDAKKSSKKDENVQEDGGDGDGEDEEDDDEDNDHGDDTDGNSVQPPTVKTGAIAVPSPAVTKATKGSDKEAPLSTAKASEKSLTPSSKAAAPLDNAANGTPTTNNAKKAETSATSDSKKTTGREVAQLRHLDKKQEKRHLPGNLAYQID